MTRGHRRALAAPALQHPARGLRSFCIGGRRSAVERQGPPQPPPRLLRATHLPSRGAHPSHAPAPTLPCSIMDCSNYGPIKFRVLYRAPPPLPAALAYREMLMRRQASLDERQQREREEQHTEHLRRVKSLPCPLSGLAAGNAQQQEGGLGQPLHSMPTPCPAPRARVVALS